MALSDYEKQVLQQMEAELRLNDPDLAREMSAGAGGKSRASADAHDFSPENQTLSSGPLSPRRLALGFLLLLTGLGVLVLAVSLGHGFSAIALGLSGFLLMLGGVLFALHTKKGEGVPSPPVRKPSRSSRSSGWASFLADQERRWDERGNH